MSVINIAKLNAVLQMSLQHQAQLLLMVQNMLDEAEKNIAQIQHYVQHQQRLELQQLLHKIRGGYATLGAEQLALTSRTLEHALENNAPFGLADFAELIRVYQQTCTEMRHEILRYPQAATANQLLDFNQLYTMLVQQDMQACQLAQTGKSELVQLLGPAAAARFSQHVGALEFSTAAEILQPHLPSNRETKR